MQKRAKRDLHLFHLDLFHATCNKNWCRFFLFLAMADYQYLPMAKAKDGVYQSLRDQLVIDRFLPRTWLKEPARLHMPPPIFTRFGRPIFYCYRETQNHGKGHAMATNPSSNIIGIGMFSDCLHCKLRHKFISVYSVKAL